MRRFLLAAIAALWVLSACNGSDLPPPYGDLEVPAGLLASASARERSSGVGRTSRTRW